MIEIYAHEHPKKEVIFGPSIFLAGPSPRAEKDYNWRPKTIDYLNKKVLKAWYIFPCQEMENGYKITMLKKKHLI